MALGEWEKHSGATPREQPPGLGMKLTWQVRWICESAAPIVENAVDMALEPLGFRLEHVGRPVGGGEGVILLRIEADDSVAWRRPLFETAASLEADLLLSPGDDAPKRPELFVFDGDGTLLMGETIDELARVAGSFPDVAAITARAMRGELDFKGALRERVALLRGLSVGSLATVREALPLAPGARETVAELRKDGVRCALFTGGFHFLADELGRELGLDDVRANRLRSESGFLLGEIEGDIVDATAKATGLLELCAEYGIPPERSWAMGDGANDRPMLEAAGTAWGYRPKEILYDVLDGAIFGGDWRAMLRLSAE